MSAIAPEDSSADATPPIAGIDTGWQPLPKRSRNLFLFGALINAGILLVPLAVMTFHLYREQEWLGWLGIVAMFLLPVFLIWLAFKRYRYTRWRLDEDGFALRRGRLWQLETRVPGSRLQHLDIRRGPIERMFGLATLVLHTAGTRHSAIAANGLDAGDAERLRDHPTGRIEQDDDA